MRINHSCRSETDATMPTPINSIVRINAAINQ
jgi:hypothetical protein